MLSATRSQTDDSYKKDYKFLISDKENVQAKRDTDMLILAKDSGKQFTSSNSVQFGGGESVTYRWRNADILLSFIEFLYFFWPQPT